MNDGEKQKLTQKLERGFLRVVRSGLSDDKAQERVAAAKKKYPGLTREALADLLIKRATRKTGAIGTSSGAAITGCEALVAAPIPEPGHKVAAGAGAVASIVGDLTATTAIQMQLLQDIAHVYSCPFDETDEEDVWLVYAAAQGTKGIERAGSFARFVFKEAATKQFRKLLRGGIRRAVQNQVTRVAGKRVGKALAEKYLLRLIPVANIGLGFWFNRRVTKRVGHWAKVRARIRSGVFRILDKLQQENSDVGALVLPILFHVAISADSLTDNSLVLYAQTAKRLELSDEEVAAIQDLNEEGSLERFIEINIQHLTKGNVPELLMEVAVTAAAASRLEVLDQHDECLHTLGEALGVVYSKSDLKSKVKELLH